MYNLGLVVCLPHYLLRNKGDKFGENTGRSKLQLSIYWAYFHVSCGASMVGIGSGFSVGYIVVLEGSDPGEFDENCYLQCSGFFLISGLLVKMRMMMMVL